MFRLDGRPLAALSDDFWGKEKAKLVARQEQRRVVGPFTELQDASGKVYAPGHVPSNVDPRSLRRTAPRFRIVEWNGTEHGRYKSHAEAASKIAEMNQKEIADLEEAAKG